MKSTSGGGNRDGARDVVRGADLAAKQLRSQAAKVGRHCYADNETGLDAKMLRGIDAKSVSEAARSLEVDKSVSRWDDKSETAVGRICQSDNKIKTLYNTS